MGELLGIGVSWRMAQNGLYTYTLSGQFPTLPAFEAVRADAREFVYSMAYSSVPEFSGSAGSTGYTPWAWSTRDAWNIAGWIGAGVGAYMLVYGGQQPPAVR